LKAPSILDDIKTIVKDAQSILTKVDDLWSSNSTSVPVQIHPFSAASQLYLRSLHMIDSKEFKKALDFAIEASAKLRVNPGPITPTVTAMNQAIDSLPARILKGIERFLTDRSLLLSADSLGDCFSTVDLLFTNYPTFSTPQIRTPATFLETFLVRRVALFVKSAEQINDLCLSLISLIEALVAFLAASKRPDLSRLLDSVIATFDNSFKSALPKFATLELRDILRDGRTISDALRSRTAAPRFVAAAREISLSVNLWNVPFLNVFASLAAQSIETSITSLELPTAVHKILNSVGSFNAVQFTLGRGSDLKTRSSGLSPLITECQRTLDSFILLISSQLHSQPTPIATVDMLARPLTTAIVRTCTVLNSTITQSPLTVCLIAGALASPSVSPLLSDSAAEQVSRLQNAAAMEWARRTAGDLKPSLAALPRAGAAMSYLIRLENAILEAGGHAAVRPLDVCLRSEAFATVVAHFQSVVKAMDIRAVGVERRQNEAHAERLFQDFCLLSRVLSAAGHADTRQLCIRRMNPIGVDAALARIDVENENAIFQSRELIKLISGGKRTGEPGHLAEFDPTQHLALLLGRK
jgi:hypothetical protein